MTGIVIPGKREPGLLIANAGSERDYALAQHIADVLAQHYPGYTWAVNAGVREGLIDICLASVTQSHGYTIKIQGLFSWDDLRDRVIRAGGEELERHNLPRKRMDYDDIREQPRDFTGIVVGEHG